ncbi:MAG: glycosyltransferase [Thermoplasmatota archaeon]
MSDAQTASVIVTVRNEARHVADLLDSLVVQEGPLEIVVVDAASTDHTADIVRSYQQKYDFVKLFVHPSLRGEGRNFGVAHSTGELVAFIDGDCIANPFWLSSLRRQLRRSDIAAGRTIQIGYWAFEALHRVELRVKGMDVSFPSCNLAYRKDAFAHAGGFDDAFHTAEDIDLNFRAVERGYRIDFADNAIVYHRARDTFAKFLKQAYWNGYGRKQLTLKHGRLWGSYKLRNMLHGAGNPWGFLRLASASAGYFMATLKERRPATVTKLKEATHP